MQLPGAIKRNAGYFLLSGSVGIRWLDDQVERRAVMFPDGCEVTHVPRRQANDTEILGECDHRPVDKAQAQIRETAIDFHGSRELAESRRRVDESAARKILHERMHRAPFVSKKVVDLSEHETRNVTGARLIDRATEQPVVRRARNQVVEQRAGITDQRSCTTGCH